MKGERVCEQGPAVPSIKKTILTTQEIQILFQTHFLWVKNRISVFDNWPVSE